MARETVDSISIASIARVLFEKEVSRKLHCWTKQMENQDPPPPPLHLPPNQGRKNGVFWFSCGFILDVVGDGGLLFHFILTNCIYHHVKENSIVSKSRNDSALFIQPSRDYFNCAITGFKTGIRENWQGRFFLILKRPFNWSFVITREKWVLWSFWWGTEMV